MDPLMAHCSFSLIMRLLISRTQHSYEYFTIIIIIIIIEMLLFLLFLSLISEKWGKKCKVGC